MGFWDKPKQQVGSLLGGVGGFTQGIFGENPYSSGLRDLGGQLTSGQRYYNLAPQTSYEQSQNLYSGPTAESIMRQSGNTSGTVLGASTSTPTYTTPTNPVQLLTQPPVQQPGGPSFEDMMRSQIEGGYSNYFGELDNMLNTSLPGQQAAQTGIANTSYNTNVTDLGLQREQNQADLNIQGQKTETNQVKTLKDISSNIRNLMSAGNTYLGSMGAGDSSAVNQYAYGLTKLGSQQRGDVQSQTAQILSDIADRGSKLNNVYMQEKNRLAGERDTRIGQIADWFATAQQQLQQAKASGQLDKSQDLQALSTNLYNQAVTQLTNIQQQTAQNQASLESWAMSNATNLAQLKQNMSQIGSYTAPQQQYGQISGSANFAPQGTSGAVYGGAGTTDEQLKKSGLWPFE